jgi:hypothetical protein
VRFSVKEESQEPLMEANGASGLETSGKVIRFGSRIPEWLYMIRGAILA